MPSVIGKVDRIGQQRKGAAIKRAEEFQKSAAKIMEVYSKFLTLFNDPKRKAKGITRLDAKCPRPGCGGTIHARLAGPKRHLWFSCSNANRDHNPCFYVAMS
jgi:hypothetical protein